MGVSIDGVIQIFGEVFVFAGLCVLWRGQKQQQSVGVSHLVGGGIILLPYVFFAAYSMVARYYGYGCPVFPAWISWAIIPGLPIVGLAVVMAAWVFPRKNNLETA